MTTRSPLRSLSADELATFLAAQQEAYATLQARELGLDLTRGKPSSAQLDLSDALLDLPTSTTDATGTDVRNYGGLEGLAQLREIFAELLEVEKAQLICGGNSSLTMMHQALTYLLLWGGPGSERAWKDEPMVKFVCPVPGYDRHFSMLADFGIEMLTVPMHDDGPDVEAVAALVADDPAVKGMWVVPTYANPTGSVVSPDVARALMSMPTAAPDFRVFWDNAYALHHLGDDEVRSADALGLAAEAGNPDRPVMFASTSKITWAGAGVAFMAMSEANKAWFLRHLSMASIGPDKVNHLRHV